MWARKWENTTMEIQGFAMKPSGPGILPFPLKEWTHCCLVALTNKETELLVRFTFSF